MTWPSLFYSVPQDIVKVGNCFENAAKFTAKIKCLNSVFWEYLDSQKEARCKHPGNFDSKEAKAAADEVCKHIKDIMKAEQAHLKIRTDSRNVRILDDFYNGRHYSPEMYGLAEVEQGEAGLVISAYQNTAAKFLDEVRKFFERASERTAAENLAAEKKLEDAAKTASGSLETIKKRMKKLETLKERRKKMRNDEPDSVMIDAAGRQTSNKDKNRTGRASQSQRI